MASVDRAEFKADFEAMLAEKGQALNDDGCLIPANTKGDGQPCECPCHREGRRHDGA